ncbi:hypothetical protein [Sphingomonas bacterium]|uniref:hypothetical protein n=1 Tax=Sphingomonas bacterium TaxID=1895847 RepID=UPI00261F03BB|nr:hypothetical protein [Sphingomonas bacterium]MDB5677760.1 hypothetical protein [Sphingomonas bacterium]
MIIAAFLLGDVPCAGIDQNLPREIAGWTSEAGGAMVPGRPVVLTTFDKPVPPEKLGFPLSVRFARTAFEISKTGRYRIALPHWARIDLISPNGMLMTAIENEKDWGYGCSTIEQMQSFDLKPGRYDLTLSSLVGPTITVMLVAARSCHLPRTQDEGVPGEDAITTCTAGQ